MDALLPVGALLGLAALAWLARGDGSRRLSCGYIALSVIGIFVLAGLALYGIGASEWAQEDGNIPLGALAALVVATAFMWQGLFAGYDASVPVEQAAERGGGWFAGMFVLFAVVVGLLLA